MTVEDPRPSQVTRPQGFQVTPDFAPENLDALQANFVTLDAWHVDVFSSETPPLPRQAGQLRQEMGEVGEEVFGLTPDQLASLPFEKRDRIGSEVADVIIAGYGTIRALGFRYEEIRVRHETDVYDASAFSELERWQIDANGRDVPLHLRLSDFGTKAVDVHRSYDQLGTEDVDSLTDQQKTDLAIKISGLMTSGLSAMNGMSISFERKFKEAYETIKDKYPRWLLDELRERGFDESGAWREAKKMHRRGFRNKSLPDGTQILIPREEV